MAKPDETTDPISATPDPANTNVTPVQTETPEPEPVALPPVPDGYLRHRGSMYPIKDAQMLGFISS